MNRASALSAQKGPEVTLAGRAPLASADFKAFKARKERKGSKAFKEFRENVEFKECRDLTASTAIKATMDLLGRRETRGLQEQTAQ